MRVPVSEVRPCTRNVFLLWEYPFWNLEALVQLTACLRTLCHFNDGRVIHLFSNALQAGLLRDVAPGTNTIRLVTWSPEELARGTPFDAGRFGPDRIGWRHFSDQFRMACLWRWGGTYTDTDNICIAGLPKESNLVSRTYDPHSFDRRGEALIPGKLRDGPDKARYDSIPFRLRADPMVNFEPEHRFIGRVVRAANRRGTPPQRKWQALMTELFIEQVNSGATDVHARLLLVYFPDGRGCYDYSEHDRCIHGGEICDILFESCPDIGHVGRYRTRRRRHAEAVLTAVRGAFPSGCFLWAKGHHHFCRWRGNRISNWIVQLIREQTGQSRPG